MLLSSISFMVCPYAFGTDVRKVYGVSATPATNFPTGEVARLESGLVLIFESVSYTGLNVCEAAGSLPMVFCSTFGAGVFWSDCKYPFAVAPSDDTASPNSFFFLPR